MIQMLYPITQEMLTKMCDEARKEMKLLDDKEIGSM